MLSRELVASEDASGQASCRIATARLLAERGKTDEAVRLADEGAALMATEELINRIDLLLHQAEVFRRAGREQDAVTALEHAIELGEQKRAAGEVRRAHERLAALTRRS